MNYYGGKELAAAFRTVRKNTIQIAEDMPENKYDFKPSPESRTIGQTLAHIAVATTVSDACCTASGSDRHEKIDFAEYMKKVGAEEAKPRTRPRWSRCSRIGREVRGAARVAPTIRSCAESWPAPAPEPPSRTRFDMVLAAKEHEMHHRAQLMLISG